MLSARFYYCVAVMLLSVLYSLFSPLPSLSAQIENTKPNLDIYEVVSGAVADPVLDYCGKVSRLSDEFPELGRPALVWLLSRAPRDFNLRKWALSAGGAPSHQHQLDEQQIPLYLNNWLNDQSAQEALDTLASSAPDEFDLLEWAMAYASGDYHPNIDNRFEPGDAQKWYEKMRAGDGDHDRSEVYYWNILGDLLLNKTGFDVAKEIKTDSENHFVLGYRSMAQSGERLQWQRRYLLMGIGPVQYGIEHFSKNDLLDQLFSDMGGSVSVLTNEKKKTLRYVLSLNGDFQVGKNATAIFGEDSYTRAPHRLRHDYAKIIFLYWFAHPYSIVSSPFSEEVIGQFPEEIRSQLDNIDSITDIWRLADELYWYDHDWLSVKYRLDEI